ncbi:MerR family transcriptional regulator [Amycolatopsis sp. CA-128772]|uniref:MerR family transcriptional regulator n=1 Tax=Amycolatopsis sp. CA-128772 TaxID=2073159 RepID=UPI000CD1F659|nr:MerR family transcriptional regulator [Amycolatopsis sp. CA-128772]
MSTSSAPAASWPAGTVARMLGLPPSTLRAWHRRYHLPLSAPQTGSHRRYSSTDVAALTRMKYLIEQGFSTESAARRAFHADGATDVVTLLAAVRQLKIDAATAFLEAHLAAHDVVATWEQLCRPALAALCGPDADHCIDLVQGLSWAIAAALHRVTTAAGAPPPVLLACAEGDRHTLPLEALRAALAEQGRTALFLGPSLPDTALQSAVDRTNPAAALVWASRAAGPLPRIRGTRLILAGPGWPATAAGEHPATLQEAVALLIRW